MVLTIHARLRFFLFHSSGMSGRISVSIWTASASSDARSRMRMAEMVRPHCNSRRASVMAERSRKYSFLYDTIITSFPSIANYSLRVNRK